MKKENNQKLGLDSFILITNLKNRMQKNHNQKVQSEKNFNQTKEDESKEIKAFNFTRYFLPWKTSKICPIMIPLTPHIPSNLKRSGTILICFIFRLFSIRQYTFFTTQTQKSPMIFFCEISNFFTQVLLIKDQFHEFFFT